MLRKLREVAHQVEVVLRDHFLIEVDVIHFLVRQLEIQIGNELLVKRDTRAVVSEPVILAFFRGYHLSIVSSSFQIDLLVQSNPEIHQVFKVPDCFVFNSLDYDPQLFIAVSVNYELLWFDFLVS